MRRILTASLPVGVREKGSPPAARTSPFVGAAPLYLGPAALPGAIKLPDSFRSRKRLFCSAT
jgi:hypothetical protein